MEISIRTTKTIVLVTLLFAGVVQSAVIPEKDRRRPSAETWAEEYNLVEPPPSNLYLANLFVQPKEKETPAVSLKTIIKALYQMNAFDDKAALEDQRLEAAGTPLSHHHRLSEISATIEETTSSIEMSPAKDSDSLESPEETTPSLGILLEDLVDAVNMPLNVESDRTEKFTHSFRYGYGIPFHPQGL